MHWKRSGLRDKVFNMLAVVTVIFLATVGYHASALHIGEVRHLGTVDGLSSHRVYSIVEDDDKVIWIGTKNGVDRFNGREVRKYLLPGDFYLGDMAARKIQLHKDAQGRLWAYDNTGRVYSYSKIHDRFNQELKLGDHVGGEIMLNRFITCGDGTMLFGLSKGLVARDSMGRFHDIVRDVYVNDISVAGEWCFVGTNAGVFAFDRSGPADTARFLDGISVETVYYDSIVGRLYAGTFNDGMWSIDRPSQAASGPRQVVNVTDPIRSISRLDDATIAVGIDGGGVWLYDIATDKSDLLVDSDDRNEFSIKGNGIYALAVNDIGDIWAGSYTGGASLIKFSPSPVKEIVHEKANPNSLANSNVNGIAQSADGSIWYATDSGVDIMDSSGDWRHTLRDKVCVSICPADDGRMAVGTYGDGIYIIDRNGNVVRHLRKQPSGMTSNNVFSIVRDADGDFWVGAIDGDLMLLDRDLNLKRAFPVSPVMSLSIVDANRMAASTVNGFYTIDKREGVMKDYATSHEQQDVDMSAYVIPMLFNGDGTVWLGTEGGGLNLYDMGTRRLLQGYKTSDGLPSNDIYSLVRDKKGAIWIGTGDGVALLRDSVMSSLNYLYGTVHEYNKSSGTLLANGDVILGGISGAVRFSPDGIGPVDFSSPLRIVSFVIDGLTPEKADKMAGSLHEGINKGTISLGHDNNSFTVSFESVNLRYQDDITYRYFLDNFDTEWNTTTTGLASYKNLAPGRYVLMLRAVRTSDNSTIDGRDIILTISQPWYNTWWAWTLYIIVIVGAAFFAIRYKLDNVKKRYYEDKIRFFINTAHDIRTPVTLAMAPLEDAVKDRDMPPSTYYLVETAYRNIKKLKTIVSQLLDFEKIDNNRASMSKECIDLCDVLREEAGYFHDACSRKQITLTLDVPDEPACIWADLNLMETVFDNLMSNACKYTAAGGKITLKLEATKSKVTVSVSDSGIGIPRNERKHIFSEVYRAQNARNTQEIGTGFGLLQVKRIVGLLGGKISFSSSEAEGTTFTLSFNRIYDTPVGGARRNPVTNSMDEIFSAETPADGVGDAVVEKANTILIVEDNDDMRRYLGSVFSREYNVALRQSADEALDYIATDYPDLIISDVMMPGMQGDDFCNYVKENPATAGIPVILLTARSGHDAIVSGLTKGADDYLSKPFSTEILKLKVKGLIANRDRQRDHLLRSAIGKVAETAQVNDESYAATSDAATEELTADSDRAFVEKTTNLIIGNISDTSFTIDTLCREMAMSRTLFYGRLKSLTGKAPQEFIRLLRLEMAADMLRKGMSVSDAAEATGFVNVKYFSTLFKKHFGVQPSKFNPENND